MATHFICHSTEPLPHQFSPIKALGRDHGAVSQYEVLNIPSKPHTRFPPPDWNFSQSSEEDSLPLCQPPAPTWKTPSTLLMQDPQLCLTPDKGSRQLQLNQKSNLKQDAEGLSQNKTKHRVRFDIDSSDDVCELSGGDEIQTVFSNGGVGSTAVPVGKTYKPNLYAGDDGEESEYCVESRSKCRSKTVHYTVGKVGSSAVYVGLDEEMGDPSEKSDDPLSNMTSTRTKTVGYSVGNSGPCQKPAVIDPKTAKHDSVRTSIKSSKDVCKRKVAVVRETPERPVIKDYNFPFLESDADSRLEYEHVFTRPEYNSTLKLSTELQMLKESSVDVTRALKKKLAVSETKASEINEKAASRVNTEATFSGLVSLEVPVEDLRAHVEQKKNSRVRTTKVIKEKPQVDGPKREPDVLDFFSPNLQKEIADFTVPGPSLPQESLCTAIQSSALDLYRHNQVWESS